MPWVVPWLVQAGGGWVGGGGVLGPSSHGWAMDGVGVLVGGLQAPATGWGFMGLGGGGGCSLALAASRVMPHL
jgi:hypothetical protein